MRARLPLRLLTFCVFVSFAVRVIRLGRRACARLRATAWRARAVLVRGATWRVVTTGRRSTRRGEGRRGGRGGWRWRTPASRRWTLFLWFDTSLGRLGHFTSVPVTISVTVGSVSVNWFLTSWRRFIGITRSWSWSSRTISFEFKLIKII